MARASLFSASHFSYSFSLSLSLSLSVFSPLPFCCGDGLREINGKRLWCSSCVQLNGFEVIATRTTKDTQVVHLTRKEKHLRGRRMIHTSTARKVRTKTNGNRMNPSAHRQNVTHFSPQVFFLGSELDGAPPSEAFPASTSLPSETSFAASPSFFPRPIFL